MSYLFYLLLGAGIAITVRAGLPGLPFLGAAVALIVFQTLRKRDQDLAPRNDIEKWIFGTCANWALYNYEYVPGNTLMPNYERTPHPAGRTPGTLQG